MMPLLWMRAAAAAAILAAIVGAGWYVHHTIDRGGYDRAMREVAEAAQADHDRKGIDLAGVGIAFAAEAQKERIVEKKIIERVTEYVPITDPLLSGGFRLLHDAAALGQALDGTGRIDAAPVAAQDAARTLAENYADCRYEKLRIVKLQDVVRALNGEKSPD
jgi:hypothetical protein